MNKIYNNLSVENLIKTEWFNQFDKKQKKLIIEGIQENLNVLLYAKKEYNWKQMDEIRLGLKDNLDISVFLKSILTNLFRAHGFISGKNLFQCLLHRFI